MESFGMGNLSPGPTPTQVNLRSSPNETHGILQAKLNAEL